MKTFFLAPIFLLLSLSISGAAIAAPNLPASPLPSISVGNRVFTDVTNLIILYGYCAGTNNHATFRTLNGTAGYTPSGSKTYVAQAIKFSSGGTAALQFGIGYASNDVGFASATAFTSGVYMGGAASTMFNSVSGVGSNGEAPISFTVLNAKYPFLDCSLSNGTAGVFLYGYEK